MQDVAQPDGGANLLFDFPSRQSKEPLQNPQAAQTNLFLYGQHDARYFCLYGFDEEGAISRRKITGKGAGGGLCTPWHLIVGLATPKTIIPTFLLLLMEVQQNANVFVECSGGGLRIDSPDEIKGFIDSYGTMVWRSGAPHLLACTIVGSVVIAKDIDLSNPTACCKTITTDLTGKIALIDGGCAILAKKQNWQKTEVPLQLLFAIFPVSMEVQEKNQQYDSRTVSPNKSGFTNVLKKIRLRQNQAFNLVKKLK